MQNNTALSAIQQKYAGYNLLMPTSSEVQLNPFYKVTVMEVPVDLSENSGDVFKVGSVKAGVDHNGKDIWEDTFSPAKPLLMKLAAAAGIQFDPEHTYGTRVDKNTYKAKAFGAMRMPDGTGRTQPNEKVLCLDDEEANYRIEFMDKSIKGITDNKAAKAAAEMFKGKWIDSTDKWGKKCQAYVIDDLDREKYIERSVLVNMTLLRKTAAEKALTGAINRVIRALIGLKGQYTKEELKKPFAIMRVTFAPDYNDPEVKRAMISQGMSSVGSLFGSPAIATIRSTEAVTSDPLFDANEFVDNPAFASDHDADDVPEDAHTEAPMNEPAEQKEEQPQQTSPDYVCDGCGSAISDKVYEYSITKFGKPLCVKCQRGGAK